MAFNLPGRAPPVRPAASPLGVGSARGVTSSTNVNAFGSPFGGQSGGVTAPAPNPVSRFGGPFSGPTDRQAAGFGGIGGRMINGQWFPFSPPQQQQAPPSAPPAGGGPAVGDGAGGVGGGSPNLVNTSIQPSGVFSPDQTQIATNQAVADSIIPLDFAMKPFIRPGASRSNSTVGAALPAFSAGLLSAANAQAQIPLFDRLTNLNQRRLGEVAREEEFFGLAGIGATLQEQDQFSRLALLQPALSLADRLLA